MAGDWIKMRGNLWDDPRVARICDLTDSGEAAVIGALYWLWSTAERRRLSVRDIDDTTKVQGFALAAWRAGFLSGDWQDGFYVVERDALGPLYVVGVDRLRPFAAAWQRLRAVVFARDGYQCTYCGAVGVLLECDHVVPLAAGGSNSQDNLTTACRPCNRSKAAKPLDVWKACK